MDQAAAEGQTHVDIGLYVAFCRLQRGSLPLLPISQISWDSFRTVATRPPLYGMYSQIQLSRPLHKSDSDLRNEGTNVA
jgi:hypothetical protein